MGLQQQKCPERVSPKHVECRCVFTDLKDSSWLILATAWTNVYIRLNPTIAIVTALGNLTHFREFLRDKVKVYIQDFG
ncbi:hypothetical protein IMCC3135_22375 [Granulosicoccus antarcticus IMCC3135]|uniref:Uncharacterized protein n=1 Tax=Granulosicoccus antarcticus IMCC3135 TaxID=1192854 RepID=A0A2Z2NVK7_9GAMM|nr:hypothetical protein IMCC3135_22375 [Granulosicoccus antarcticus IMCC3135]